MTHVFASMNGYNPQGTLGNGHHYRICYALDAGVQEVRRKFPRITSVGVLGDQTHQGEGDLSAHNPLILAPDGSWLVLAVDLVGPLADLTALQHLIEKRYNARDARQWPFGFTQMNGYGTVWDNDPHTELHYTGADYGHLHWNINTINFPIRNVYKPFMDDTSSWGIATSVPVTKPVPKPAPAPASEEEEDMALPYLAYAVDKPTVVIIVWPNGRVRQTISPTTVKGYLAAGCKRVGIQLSSVQGHIKDGAKL